MLRLLSVAQFPKLAFLFGFNTASVAAKAVTKVYSAHVLACYFTISTCSFSFSINTYIFILHFLEQFWVYREVEWKVQSSQHPTYSFFYY